MLSIRCLAYNHEPYIRECLEGFVMQKTNFRFEAIVHDDASTDGTADIIREYAEKYPDIIKPIFETENQYSKHDGSLGRIMNEACTGKYIAMCEGDDYWTDPLKLQKQVDFLETHNEYSMCVSNRRVLLHDGTFYEDIQPWTTKTREDVLKGYIPHTQTIVYLLSDKKLFESSCREVISPFGDGDRAIAWYATKIGKIYNYPEQLAVYRLGVGVMSAVQENQLEYFRIESYVGFQHRINIPDRKLYVSCLTDKCWDLYYYSHKRKQTELFESADKALKLWRKELTFVEQVGCFSKYFSTKIKRHKKGKIN